MAEADRLGEVDPRDLTSIRLELHHAVQLIAAFGQTFVPARKDDSHRSMTWEVQDRAFASEWGGTTPKLRLMLRPKGLEVSVWAQGDAGQAAAVDGSIADPSGGAPVRLAERSLSGCTLEDAYAWTEATLGEASGNSEPAQLGRPEYEMPEHPVMDGAVFSRDAHEALQELGRWYAQAAKALHSVASNEPDATEIRCWPHHFDLATLILLDPLAGPTEGRSVGVGFSPGDGATAQPYWYVNLYPQPENPVLPELSGGGYWNTDGWLGAVLTGDAIVSAGAGAAQDDRIRTFLRTAVAAAKRLL
jgi:hypothetical protein